MTRTTTWDFEAPERAARYLREGPPAFAPGHAGLLQMIGVLIAERAPPRAEILVVGAGGGLETRHLAAINEDWTFVGVDPSPVMLSLARETLGSASQRVRLIEGVAAEAPEGPFDAATCVLVLGLIPDDGSKASTLVEVRRRLRPGVPFVLVDLCIDLSAPDAGSRLDRYAAYAQASGVDPNLVAGARSAISQSTTMVSAQRNENLLMEAGFANQEVFYVGMGWRGWIAYA